MVTEYDYIDAKENLDKLFDIAEESHMPVKIVRSGGSSAYVISEDDFDSLEETLYLLSSPKNAKQLRKAIASKEVVRFNSIEDLRRDIRI